MINSMQTLAKETWNLILDECSDLNSLINLSKVNKQTRELTLAKLENIKININELYTALYKIQDVYTIKYQNINGANVDITNPIFFMLINDI